MGAGNIEKDIDVHVKEWRDVCLTCGARARSVVTVEADRTQHGRMAGEEWSGRCSGCGDEYR